MLSRKPQLLGILLQKISTGCKSLYDPLKSYPPKCSTTCTIAVKTIKLKAKKLSCLSLPHSDTFKIVETDASKLGFGGILK